MAEIYLLLALIAVASKGMGIYTLSPMDSLVFDLDDVLWMSGEMHERCFKEIAFEIDLNFESYEEISGFSTRHAWTYLLEKYDHNFFGDIEMLVTKKQELFQKNSQKIVIKKSDLMALRERYPHTPFALVTGASKKSVEIFLARLGAEISFQIIISSDEGMLSKPSPQPYLEAATRLGISPSEMIVFEDSLSGLTSGLAAGAKTIHITNANEYLCLKHKKSFLNPFACISSPIDILDIL
jgi:beta-phosphoglucomutase-like phosphatase (HAD superfamily)